MTNKSTASLIIAIIVGVLGIITLPGFFRSYYYAGKGHALFTNYKERTEDMTWSSMTDAQHEAFEVRANAAGFKSAMFMTFGSYIPGCLFIFITIGLLTQSISHRFRIFLRFAFFGVWILGMLSLAFGSEYTGLTHPFQVSLGSAFMFYLVEATFFGIVISVGKSIQRRMATKGKIRKGKTMLRPYQHVEETDEYVAYEFRTFYLYLLYVILGMIVVGYFVSMSVLSAYGLVLMILYFLLVSTQYMGLNRVIKRASKMSSVEMSGSRWSFSHPLRIKIKKEFI